MSYAMMILLDTVLLCFALRMWLDVNFEGGNQYVLYPETSPE